jgi:DNA-binding response OmpR family regulator
MKRRILLVDDEVAVLLTMKAILEISGFEVDTAASAKEGKSKLHTRAYNMVITDMRMESDASGREVIEAARAADYHPAVALLTAFPVADEDWQEMGADKMLVKPMHTRMLLEQIEHLLVTHAAKLAKMNGDARKGPAKAAAAKPAARKPTSRKAAPKKITAAKKIVKGQAVKKPVRKPSAKAQVVAKRPVKRVLARKAAAKKKIG